MWKGTLGLRSEEEFNTLHSVLLSILLCVVMMSDCVLFLSGSCTKVSTVFRRYLHAPLLSVVNHDTNWW